MNQPPRHPITITDLQTITHSGMCDAGRTTGARPNPRACTCAAGLIKLMVGGT